MIFWKKCYQNKPVSATVYFKALVCVLKTHASLCTSAQVQPRVSHDQPGELESDFFYSGALMIISHWDFLDGRCGWMSSLENPSVLHACRDTSPHLQKHTLLYAELWHYSNKTIITIMTRITIIHVPTLTP